MRKALVIFFSVVVTGVFAQSPTVFSGYVEPYFSFDAGQPDSHERPAFLYNHTRHNEFNLNLGYLKIAHAAPTLRGNLALMGGTYAQRNLAAEQPLLRHIFEANAGLKISRKHALWLDAGVLPSHIGFESAIGKDCWTLTRSLLAENSPYYEAGAKITYTAPGEKWSLAALALNGWQRIQRLPGRQNPAFGTQLTVKPNGKTTLNWSTYLGDESAAGSRAAWRFFNNFYAIFQPTARFGLIAGLDVGLQNGDTWLAPVCIARFSPAPRWRVAARAEYFADAAEVVVSTGLPGGFQVFGASVNVDFLPAENAVLRLETRWLHGRDAIFTGGNGQASADNLALTASFGLSF